MTLSKAAQRLWAKKSSKNGDPLWLPLYIHLSDSASVARRLWNKWLPEGVKETIVDGISGLGNADPLQLFVFLAAVHDLGKATPVFQAKQCIPLNHELDVRIEEELIAAGLPMQSYQKFINASRTPHALATQVLLLDAKCSESVAAVLGSHHGKPPEADTLLRYGLNTYPMNYYMEREGKEAWTYVQRELLSFALDQAGFSNISEVPNPNMQSQVLLCGLLIMADWIASNEDYFPYIRLEDLSESLDPKTRIQEAWEILNLTDPWKASDTWKSVDLYPERFGFSAPKIMQTAVEKTAAAIQDPGILVLEAPMGSGKTEAALACAEVFAYKANCSGIFFALPTQATADGILRRIIDWINALNADSKHSLELAHGKAQFNREIQSLKYLKGSTNIGIDEEGDSGVFVHQWFEGKKTTLLADFVVGTIDQLLLAALKQKHVMLRHLGLSDKVVIIDECHAYDAYMNQYLYRALNWLGRYHVPVIVLSATLPAKKRKAVIRAYQNKDYLPVQQDDPLGRNAKPLSEETEGWTTSRDYPLITYTNGNQIKQKSVLPDKADSRMVSLDFLSEEDLVNKLDFLLWEGGCVGVIVNTVKRAQELTRILIDHFGEGVVKLLHSLFLAPDRIKKEDDLRRELGKPGGETRRPEKRIVVGTQVLEQSLDIDFDALVTDICPMDLLLQRIGRLHRHKRSRRAKLQVPQCLIMGVLGDDSFEEGAEAIYGKYLLMRTKAFLPKQVEIPKDIPQLVQNVYDENVDFSPKPADYQEAKGEQKKRIEKKEDMAKKFRISPPWSNSLQNLVGWLDTDVSEKRGEAAVRDTDESIEVLLIRETGDGRLCFLPWQEEGREISPTDVPSNHLAKALARQSIRLPNALCAPWIIDQTIEELEEVNSERLSVWQESTWLKGELFLILDSQCSGSLCGYHLNYDRTYGLRYKKEVNDNA